jgi:hypothetical protein
MDIGTGVAIAGGAISVAAVLMKWLSMAYSGNNQCIAHSVISQQITDVKEWLKRVEEKLDRVIER